MSPSARRVLVIFPRRGKDQPEVSELIETTPAAWRYTTMLAACKSSISADYWDPWSRMLHAPRFRS